MDMSVGIASPADARENDRQIALLNWARTKVGQLAGRPATRDGLGDLLDCMAYLTREHFGFQERLLKECAEQRTYLMERMAVHCEFRRRLADMYLDALRGDFTVAERLSSLCHELWLDMQTQQASFVDIVGQAGKTPKLRRRRRHDATPFHTALRFDS